MTDITQRKSWKNLQALRRRAPALSYLFTDPVRFLKFSVSVPGLLADFSKTHLTEELRDALISLAEETGLEEARDNLFTGQKVNTTENRAALHTALRAPAGSTHPYGQDIAAGVQRTLMRMRFFANTVRNGEWRGYSGKTITDIVNLGIGGSVLGPQLATEALSGYHHPRLTCHYVSNVDPADLQQVLQKISPETTLFIVASKTFTTIETMTNAEAARLWLLSHYQNDRASVASHFVAASTNTKAVEAFGIKPDNMFPFEDWVGGRYSVWSAIGLSVMVMVGPEHFAAFLAGAHDADTHFRTAPLAHNIPVLMGLTGLWYRNFMNASAYAVIPYHTPLRRLPAYLQQLDMESNGKSVTHEGEGVIVRTGPMVFGEPGTDSQHSFFQWLHQGTDVIPVDFIAAIKTPHDAPEQSRILLANMLAQSATLLSGRCAAPHQSYPGNRPSTTFLLDELTPHALGMLMAFYEHKIFTQGAIWGINSFDQFGVEHGKVLAKNIEKDLSGAIPGQHDASTLGLLDHILGRQKKAGQTDGIIHPTRRPA